MDLDILSGLELNKAIKQMRLSRKLTQVKVAGAIGVSTFTLIRWERGERAPDGIFLQKLTKMLGYSIVLNTDGLWSCYPSDSKWFLGGGFESESVDDIYRRAAEAKDSAVWRVFFNRLTENNAELETWFRKSDGGQKVEAKTFKMLSDIILTVLKSGG
ncbi:MAG: helix-turn-helix transcriptional regulator [Synergistaceae bacterium]|jgi:transcriptional regulator with XRE-family HTH domain|nr:helix-turn-helix transcriptional regulator [Synergistaceae bacterium]